MKMPSTFTENKDHVHVVIETPKGSRNKYFYDPQTGFFKFKKICPSGMFFPLDFGFIPGTIAEDGDPIDAMVFMEEPAYPGCLYECRIVGILEAEQEKEGKLIRNDRVLCCALGSTEYEKMNCIEDFSSRMIDDIVRFFKTYHKRNGEKFELIKVGDTEKALKLIRRQIVFSEPEAVMG